MLLYPKVCLNNDIDRVLSSSFIAVSSACPVNSTVTMLGIADELNQQLIPSHMGH
jgi:hypothetical protein